MIPPIRCSSPSIPTAPIAEDKIFDPHVFHHPVFDFAALAGQAALKAMQGRRRIWFCGAHLGHGFHEDGLVSAMAVAQALGAPAPWTEAREKTGRDGARPLREAGGVAVAAE